MSDPALFNSTDLTVRRGEPPGTEVDCRMVKGSRTGVPRPDSPACRDYSCDTGREYYPSTTEVDY